MKVLHVIPSLSPARGGPSFAIEAMTRALARAGVSVEIATTNDDGPGVRHDLPLGPQGEPVVREGVAVRYFERQLRAYGYSRPLTHWLEQHVRDYDLVHIHALFSHTSTSSGLIARRAGVPYIVRPLGVLNAWGMKNRRRLPKRLSFALLEKRVLEGAALIHYTGESEKRDALAAGVRSPSVVLPLGLDLEPFESLPAKSEFAGNHPSLAGRTAVLFLSRLDPVKGLDLLLPAFATAQQRHPRAILVIAGEGEPGFVEALRAQAASLGIADSVLWAGFVAGRDKMAALAACDVFVLPSYSENFGVAAAEAMAAGLPCVLSDQVGLAPQAAGSGAALVVAAQADALAQALSSLLGDAARREHLGRAAQAFTREHLSLEQATGRLVQAYRDITGIPQPSRRSQSDSHQSDFQTRQPGGSCA